jgi:hypothetical protein
MKAVSVILGYRVACCHCGVRLRKVMIPALGDRWQYCEDFPNVPEYIELHDCPKHPLKTEPVEHE